MRGATIRSGERGMTLIEVMLATTIAAVIVAAATASIVAVTRSINESKRRALLDTEVGGWPLKIYAHMVQNNAVGTEDAAYAFGAKVGAAKAEGDVEFSWTYQDIEADAVIVTGESVSMSSEATATGKLADMPALSWTAEPAITVVMAAKGYPGSYEKGSVIGGVEAANKMEGVVVFEAGTARNADGERTANGGRVLNVTASGETLHYAVDRAYAAVDEIDWPEGFCRRDIAWRALKTH